METISLNNALNIRFVVDLNEYINVIVVLRKLHFKVTYEDIYRNNFPELYKENKPEVLFTVLCEDIDEAFLLRHVVSRILNPTK